MYDPWPPKRAERWLIVITIVLLMVTVGLLGVATVPTRSTEQRSE